MDAHNLFEYQGCSTNTLFAESAETARRLARTCNPQTSKDAAAKMVKSGALNKQEKWIYEAITEFIKHRVLHKHPLNFTTKDIALFMSNNSYHKDYDICRKRFSGLERKGKIEELTGERRDGCRVWRLK